MPASPDYVEGLIHKKLYLLAMVFEQIDDSTISAFRYDVSTRTGVLINTTSQVYKLTDEEVAQLAKYQDEDSEKLTRYLDGHLRRELKLQRLLDERAELRKAVNRRLLLGAILILMTLTYIFAITFIQIPTDNQRFADGFGGIMVGCVLNSVMAYIFDIDNHATKINDSENKTSKITKEKNSKLDDYIKQKTSGQ